MSPSTRESSRSLSLLRADMQSLFDGISVGKYIWWPGQGAQDKAARLTQDHGTGHRAPESPHTTQPDSTSGFTLQSIETPKTSMDEALLRCKSVWHMAKHSLHPT